MIKRILLLGAFALATGAVVRVFTAPLSAAALSTSGKDSADAAPPPAAPAPSKAANRALWRTMWTRPTPDLQSLSLSPDGSTVAWVDSKGSVRRIAAGTGATVYQTAPAAGINSVTAAAGGSIVAFSHLNPVSPAVRVFDSTPNAEKHAVSYPVDGAVWSVAVSPKGDRAVVGTGHSTLFMVPLPVPAAAPAVGAKTVAPQQTATPATRLLQMKTSGIPDSIEIAADSPVALAGTWQGTSVSAWGMDGVARWRHDESEPDRTYDVQISADGSTAVAISSREPHGTEARLHVWDAHTGRLIWSEYLNAFDAHALVSAHGDSIAVSFAQRSGDDSSTPDETGTIERKIVLFDRAGIHKFADKGGMFFAPQLVALSRDGSRITVRDNSGYIWTLDSDGRMISRIRLSLDPTTGSPPTIKDAITSADGTSILVRRGDGQITLFKASNP